MATKIMTLPFHQNIKSKVWMAYDQIIWPYKFIKIQKLKYGWYVTK